MTRPFEFTLGGGWRMVEVRRGDRTLRFDWLPRWFCRIGPDVSVRVDWRGRIAANYCVELFTGLRSTAAEAESVYRSARRLSLRPPLQLLWIQNDCPSRAWTGREYELGAITWCGRRWWVRKRPMQTRFCPLDTAGDTAFIEFEREMNRRIAQVFSGAGRLTADESGGIP